MKKKMQSSDVRYWTIQRKLQVTRAISKTYDLSYPSGRPLTSHLPLKTYHFDSHTTHTIKTHYNTINSTENPCVTNVISETYDFFYRNSHQKKLMRTICNLAFTAPDRVRFPFLRSILASTALPLAIRTSLITIRFRRCLSYVDQLGVWARVKLWDHAF
jgi:hypothetical protein